MGAWGYAVFDDDTASDVRDGYTRLLQEKGDGPAASAALLAEWAESLTDPDEGPVVWLALALTQHKLGRLESRVKREALRAIDDALGLDRWREQGERELKRRVAALAKVKTTLLAPQPPPKTIKPPFRDSCKWEVGELIGYRLQSGAWIVLRIVAHETHPGGVAPVCELLDWTGKEPPTADTLRNAKARSAKLSTWSLFQLLSRNAPEYAAEPSLATNKLLAEIGLLDPAKAGYSPLSAAVGAGGAGPPAGFNWAKHFGEIEKAIDKLQSGDAAVSKKLREVTRLRNPKLLDPVSQLSLRREPGMESLPLRRLKRIRATQSPSPAGDWIVVRWYEFDDVIKNFFGLS